RNNVVKKIVNGALDKNINSLIDARGKAIKLREKFGTKFTKQ
ncbi:30765_t:CDS:1, partial [Gigaspora margarita]